MPQRLLQATTRNTPSSSPSAGIVRNARRTSTTTSQNKPYHPFLTMKSHGSLLLLLIGHISGFTLLHEGMLAEASPARTTTAACVRLQGIESGGTPAAGSLDLDVIKVALGDEAFNPFTSIIPIVAGCSAGLETPIAMRNLLGERSIRAPVTILRGIQGHRVRITIATYQV